MVPRHLWLLIDVCSPGFRARKLSFSALASLVGKNLSRSERKDTCQKVSNLSSGLWINVNQWMWIRSYAYHIQYDFSGKTCDTHKFLLFLFFDRSVQIIERDEPREIGPLDHQKRKKRNYGCRTFYQKSHIYDIVHIYVDYGIDINACYGRGDQERIARASVLFVYERMGPVHHICQFLPPQ